MVAVVIRSFRDGRTAAVLAGRVGKGMALSLARAAQRKLVMLDAASDLGQLAAARGSRLEKLAGDRAALGASGLTISGASVSSGGPAMRSMSSWSTITEESASMTILREDVEAGRVDLDGFAERGALPMGPVHPGEILREEFMAPAGLSARALARSLGVPPNRVTMIINGERAVSAETALRLARFFGSTAGFWLRLQAAHDEAVARATWGGRVEREVVPLGGEGRIACDFAMDSRLRMLSSSMPMPEAQLSCAHHPQI